MSSHLLVAGDPRAAYEAMRGVDPVAGDHFDSKDIQFDQARLLELLLVANEEFAQAEVCAIVVISIYNNHH
jgi:hypothetical protein